MKKEKPSGPNNARELTSHLPLHSEHSEKVKVHSAHGTPLKDLSLTSDLTVLQIENLTDSSAGRDFISTEIHTQLWDWPRYMYTNQLRSCFNYETRDCIIEISMVTVAVRKKQNKTKQLSSTILFLRNFFSRMIHISWIKQLQAFSDVRSL